MCLGFHIKSTSCISLIKSIRLFDHNIQHRILSRGVENNPPLNVRADIGSIKTTDKVLDDVATVIFFAHSSVPFSSMQDIYGDAQQNILKAIDLFEIFAKKNIPVNFVDTKSYWKLFLNCVFDQSFSV